MVSPQGPRSKKASAGRKLIGLAVLAAIGVYLVETTESSRVADVMPYAVVALLLPLLPFVLEEDADIFSPAIFTGVYGAVGMLGIVLGLANSTQIEYGGLSLSPARAEETTRVAFVVQIVASAMYLAGYYASKSGLSARVFPDVRGVRWNHQRLLIVSLICALAAGISYVWFQSRVGGSLMDLSLREGKMALRDDSTLSWVSRGIGLAQIPILFYAAIAASRRSKRELAMVMGAAGVTAFLTLRVGSRGLALFFLASALVSYHYIYRRIRPWAFAAVVLAGLAVVNALGQVRQQVDVETNATSFRPTRVLTEHAEERQRLVPMIAVVDNFPDKQDYLMGASWAGLLTAPVPRWIWAEKGLTDWDRWRDTNIARELAGVPAPTPLPFVLYANFGHLGVALGMLVWGAFHRGLATWRERASGDVNTQLLYAVVLFHFGPTLLQVSASLQYVLPTYLAILFVRQREAPLPLTSALARS